MKAPETGRDAQQKRINKLEQELKRTVSASNAIVENLESLLWIKGALAIGDLVEAENLFHELSDEDQKRLMRAYSKGGAFPRQERELITAFWKSYEV